MIFDAHCHLPVCLERGLPLVKDDYAAITCAHSESEWNVQYDFFKDSDGKHGPYYLSFGLHPQSALFSNTESILQSADFLEGLLKEGKVNAIGEAGFDYFTPQFKESAALQEKMWQIQLELALAFQKPLVVHCRKANHKLFEYSRLLKKCPAVLFHSFMGPYSEAKSLLNHEINGYFSFGKQMKNNNKKVIECVKNLPLENLLLETDAPFQTLKGEENTLPLEINSVYREAFRLRGQNEVENYEDFCLALEKNAASLLGILWE